MRIGGAGTPIPKRDVEIKSRGSGPVITYKLSPEEIAARYGPPVKRRPAGLVRRSEMSSEKQRRRAMTRYSKQNSEKEENPMSELTKENYLRMRLDGQSRTAIQREYFPSNPPKFYAQLAEWGIKEKDAEELALELLTTELKTPAVEEPKVAPPDPRDEEIARLRAELERIKADNVEAVRLSGAAAEKMQAEIERLKKDEETLSRLLTDTENKLEEVIKERDALLQTVEKAVDTQADDSVNHPAHYTAGKVECIDAIESATVGLSGGQAYATGAAIKYLWRWSRKGGVEDLKKARWYVDRLIAGLEETR